MKYTFLLIFTIFYFPIQAQSITGKVINEQGEPIEYAHIYIASKYLGVYTFANGNFTLKGTEITSGDTLSISFLGYFSKKIILSFNNTTHDVGNIQLLPKANQLPNLTITPANKLITIGNSTRITNEENKAFGFIYGKKRTFSYQVGVAMPNDKNHIGIIENVSFYINRGLKHKTPFRVRIFSLDSNGVPTQNDLLLKNVIVKPKKAAEWITVDLSEYNISIPEHGFILTMEWLYRPKRKYNKKVTIKSKNTEDEIQKRKETWFGQSLGGIVLDEEQIHNTWHCKNNNWQPYPTKKAQASIKAQIRVR